MMHRFFVLAVVGMSIFLCGCPAPSRYSRPEPPVPSEWPESAAAPKIRQDSPAASDMKWREFFKDRRLQSVIELSLDNNRDLRAAALNIEKARALFRIQRAQQYPGVHFSVDAEAYRVPESLSGGGEAETISQYRVGLGTASWEIDFFGRVRSLKSRALEQYLATEQARAAAQISLVAAVAERYLTLAADRENLKLAEATYDTQKAYYELILRTRDLGMASDLEVRQAKSQVQAAQVDIARYSGQLSLDKNALDLVAGASVAPDMLSENLDAIGTFPEISAGVPSDVLLLRPDILAAEHQLKALNANIGAARAAFFPRISLTAAVGIASSDLTNLFKPAAGTWNFAPQLLMPIFDWGAREDNYEAAQADRDIAIAQYEKSIQSAFKEVSDALSLRIALADQQEALVSLVDTLAETHRLSEARYTEGIDSYLAVLVAQRSLYAARQQLVDVRLARLSNLIRLYKVLGGGA